MLHLGPIAFASPWLLAALLVLPVLYWLLRVTPPAPRLQAFPAVEFLRGLLVREQTSAHTPWWLLLLRLVVATVLILALSEPLLNPSAGLLGNGPLLLVVDNGWTAGRDWAVRQHALTDLLDQADRQGRDVILVATAPAPNGDPPRVWGPMRAAEARQRAQALEPEPWPADRAATLKAIDRLHLSAAAHSVWLSDGLADGQDQDHARALAARLQRFGDVEVMTPPRERLARLLLPPLADTPDLTVRVVRADATLPDPVTIRALGSDGRLLARQSVVTPAGQTTTTVKIDLPLELRNQVTQIGIGGETTAGAVVLLDKRWRRRPVGLVSGRSEGSSQPLLSDVYYLERALSPFSEVRKGTIEQLVNSKLAVLILADIGTLTDTEAAALRKWVERGGVLIRFAGPHLAQHTDGLIPVRLRTGDRDLGGALSWSRPARLAPFNAASPFAGLKIPSDVTVQRQVLAEPSPDLAAKTWARLVDGTPLVTGESRGEGKIVLVHVTANPDWSNLPLSGLFVDMLRRLTRLSAGVAGAPLTGTIPPVETLDGLGRLGTPPVTAFPLQAGAPPARSATVGPHHPPGFYGNEDSRVAVNLTAAVTTVRPLAALPQGVDVRTYTGHSETDLKPLLLAIALGLIMLDLAVALVMRGVVGRRQAIKAIAAAATIGLVAAMGGFGTGTAHADEPQPQSADERALQATGSTYLAYVITGDPAVDEVSRAGLQALSEVLTQRTAVDSAGAMGVNVETDELSFFPLLYWPITPAQATLSDTARSKINQFMRSGGTILFDTRDQQFSGDPLGPGPGAAKLRELVQGLDIPPLTPIPPDHVLTKSFYLMQDFPGRYAGGELWVEAREGRNNDGVSSVIIGSNDWAAAWATDSDGQPLFAVVPGGQRQREMAYRFGINLVMYTLTGNYKADQVHVPAILERLGQ